MHAGYLALTVSILLGAGGQLGLKAGSVTPESGAISLFHPYTVAGLGAYVVASLFYIYALKTIPISVAFPIFFAVNFAIVALCSHLFWNEPFGPTQLLALVFIGAGVGILARTT